jgi:hypothetical protein
LKDKYRTSAWNFHKRAKITEREKDYV